MLDSDLFNNAMKDFKHQNYFQNCKKNIKFGDNPITYLSFGIYCLLNFYNPHKNTNYAHLFY